MMRKGFLPLFLLVVAAGRSVDSQAQANTRLSNLDSTSINRNLLPGTDNLRDLGNKLLGWRDVYASGRLFLKGELFLHSPGTNNIFIGHVSGNDYLKGIYNTAVGYFSLTNVTTGQYNTANGHSVLYSNTTGSYNTANGTGAMYHNTVGTLNTASGHEALFSNSTGSQNTATGQGALYSNTRGIGNTANGNLTLYNNTEGSYNTAHGLQALFHNSTGNSNTATGYMSLYSSKEGHGNTVNGTGAMYFTISGSFNTAVGHRALFFNKVGNYNTAIGREALKNNTGSSNTAIGNYALHLNTDGAYNTAVGDYATVAGGGIHNATALGSGARVSASNRVRIGNDYVTSIGGAVSWTSFSDGRYKKDIKENIVGLAFINSLRPVSYTVDIKGLDEYYKRQGAAPDSSQNVLEADAAAAAAIVYDGFVAQEVEASAMKLNFAFSGVDKPASEEGLYGLRYDHFVVPLVKAVQELSKKNDSLQQQNEALAKRIEHLEAIMNAKVTILNK